MKQFLQRREPPQRTVSLRYFYINQPIKNPEVWLVSNAMYGFLPEHKVVVKAVIREARYYAIASLENQN
ncbi:MAG: hypothetical protein AAF349_19620 [Cyanobacteria bacterium P01_A01_bin.68]